MDCSIGAHKQTLTMQRSLVPVYVVLFRAVRIVSHVLAVVDLHDVRTGMFAPFNLRHGVAPRNILSVSDIIVLISTARTVIFTLDFRHVLYLSQNSNIEPEIQSNRQYGVGPCEFHEVKDYEIHVELT
jgi:hypothetical protein